MVNETHKIFRGFDQGRTTHAFRNIYPIFDANGTYLCALDISFPSEVLQAYLTEIGNVHSHLLVNRNIFSVKSWKRKDFALKYFPSAEHDEYMLTMTTEHTKERCITQNRVKLANLRDEIDEKIAKQDGFAIYYEDDDKAKVVTFYPIKEEERGTTVVWIVSYEDDYMIATALEFNRLLRVTLFFLFMLLGYFIYTILTQKNILDIQVKEELRKNRQKDTHMLHQSRLAQMGEMMSMVAHQWRQPLSAISSTSTAIGVKAKINKLDSETAINLSDKILEYVEHLSNTINDFCFYSYGSTCGADSG
jgi:C4-dicarboxylate-specific signal transduction histidine kinase